MQHSDWKKAALYLGLYLFPQTSKGSHNHYFSMRHSVRTFYVLFQKSNTSYSNSYTPVGATHNLLAAVGGNYLLGGVIDAQTSVRIKLINHRAASTLLQTLTDK